MADSDSLRLNTPIVALQEIEGEAILINFDSGCYFSANKTGSALLEMAVDGASLGDMVEALAKRCGVSQSDVGDSVREFVRVAQAESLMVPSEGPGSGADGASADPIAGFEAPSLEKFDDLQDLLMLDPIHDVDQVGWPMQAPATPVQTGDGTD